MKNIIVTCLVVVVAFFVGAYSQARNETYKHQVQIPSVCDEYLLVKKSDVPIACYEYFGIK